MGFEENNNNNIDKKELSVKRKASHSYYPEWFPINNHLAIYQRHPTPCAWACIRSTCERNSELSCVWSHLIALLITIYAFVQFLRLPSEEFLHEREEKLVIGIAFTCGCICFGCSTFFHTFYHHSREVFETSLKLDLLGIVIGCKGPWIPWIYYSFYCETFFRYLYTSAVVLNACTIGWSLTRGRLLREEKAKERAVISIAMFCLTFPGYARIFYRDGFMGAMTLGHGWAFLGFFLGGVGVFVYCAKIPESWNSGKYDRLIGSHSLFHVFSALCLWLAITMAMALREHRLQVGDSCPT